MPAPTQPLTPDPTPAKELSTPDETPSKAPKLPKKPTRTDTEFSSTSEMADSDDPGYQSRSRSQSRRRRRQNQRQRQAASRADASNGASAESMASIGETNEPEPEPTTITRQPGQRLVSKRAPKPEATLIATLPEKPTSVRRHRNAALRAHQTTFAVHDWPRYIRTRHVCSLPSANH
jgi:hypothetical protein